MAATLQRKGSGGINFVIITMIITKIVVPRSYFVIISARMVRRITGGMRWLTSLDGELCKQLLHTLWIASGRFRMARPSQPPLKANVSWHKCQ